MRIINGGEIVAELPDAPKDFSCTWDAGAIQLETPDGTKAIGKCDRDEAMALINKIHAAYFGGDAEFIFTEVD